MKKVKLCRSLLAGSLAMTSLAALAYQDRDFAGASDGPALSSDHSQSLDFGFNSPSDPGAYGLRAVSGQGAGLNETAAPARQLSRPRSPSTSREVDQFNRDFYGAP